MNTNKLKSDGTVDDARGQAGPSYRMVLMSLSLSAALASLNTSIVNVGLPDLALAFGASFAAVQWVVIAYLLAVTALVVGAGRLGDIVGRKRLLLLGLSLFAVSSLLCGVAGTLWALIAARAVQGLAAAIMMALTMALVTEALPKSETGRALGLLGAMSAIGTCLGPSLGGLLLATLGWRALFLVSVPLAAVTLGLAIRFLPADETPTVTSPEAFDVRGTALLALALAAYALAVTAGGGHLGPQGIALLAVAGIAAGAFVLVERRSPSPLVGVDAFNDMARCAAFAATALVAAVMMATLVVGPFYLSRALGLQAAQVGMVLSAGPFVAAMAGVPAGRIVDRHGSGPATVAGLLAIGSGSLGLAVLPLEYGVPGYLAFIVIITAGYALFQAANGTAIMQSAGAGQRGVISGILNLFRNLGLITGASVMGAVFAGASGTRDVATAGPDAVANGLHTTFRVAALLMALTVAVVLAGRTPVARRRTAVSAH